jgi:hypothetical protein
VAVKLKGKAKEQKAVSPFISVAHAKENSL